MSDEPLVLIDRPRRAGKCCSSGYDRSGRGSKDEG